MNEIIQIFVLFFVLFDPLASLAVFVSASQDMIEIERRKTALYAIVIAGILAFGTLFLGEGLLKIFNTNISDFRIAGGILLIILGIRMALGKPLEKIRKGKDETGMHPIAALIATPLLTGPAVMTSTIILRYQYGLMNTGIAILIVLLITTFMFLNSKRIMSLIGKNAIQIVSTFLGMVTIAWGVAFLRESLKIFS